MLNPNDFDQFFDAEFPLIPTVDGFTWQAISPGAIAEMLIRSETEPDIDLALDIYEQAYMAVTDDNRNLVAAALKARGSSMEVLSHNI
jgi:hypothetical protein